MIFLIETFSTLVQVNESLLLLEKCNILSAREKELTSKQLEKYRSLYTIDINNVEEDTSDSDKANNKNKSDKETIVPLNYKSYSFESLDYDYSYWDVKVADSELAT